MGEKGVIKTSMTDSIVLMLIIICEIVVCVRSGLNLEIPDLADSVPVFQSEEV